MTPLKDTLEAATPTAEIPAAQSTERPKAEAGHLRSDAVSLDVQVKVHGSRTSEAAPGTSPQTEPFEEQASTMIVFPQGGVLRMSTPVNAGQMLVLTNIKSGHDAICRVVKVRANAQSQSYVELEFTSRQAGYWGVRFAGDDVEPTRTILPPPPQPPIALTESDAAPAKTPSKSSPEISWAPAASLQPPAAKFPEPAVFLSPVKPPSHAPHRPAPPSKKESSFVAIGSQEDVQPAASATTNKKKPERAAPPAASLSMAELRGETHVTPPAASISVGAGVPGEMTDLSEALAESSQEKAPAPFGRLAASASLSGASAEAPVAFGSRFGAATLGVTDQAAETPKESGRNWLGIAAGIAALLAVGVGGAFYFHLWPAGNSNAPPSSLPVAAISSETPAVTPSTGSSVAQLPISKSQAPANQPGPSVGASAPGVPAHPETVVANASKAPVAEHADASAPLDEKSAKRAADIAAAVNAHPVASQRSSSDDAAPAPSVDAGDASAGGALQGITVSSELAPPPPAETKAPIKQGGDVKPPKIISSVLPIYPSIAKSTGIQGSVVVETSIDATGKVVATKVLSGPPVLRQAAIDALRRWKYQPAMLNGEPIDVKVDVTLDFHN
jgi:TonB family protein